MRTPLICIRSESSLVIYLLVLNALSIYILNGVNDKRDLCLTPFSIFAFPHTLLLPFLISVALPILVPLKIILNNENIDGS